MDREQYRLEPVRFVITCDICSLVYACMLYSSQLTTVLRMQAFTKIM